MSEPGVYDLIIIGSGAAGYGAAIYAGRYLMKPVVIRGKFGGETATAGQIWNYPGVPGADGYELMKAMEKQALDSEATQVDGKVVSAKRDDGGCYTITVETPKGEQLEYQANTLIFAQGAERRRLGLPNEDELTGKGVHYCVTCDGPVYGGKEIAIVGGGDASVKGIIDLAKYVSKIYFIVRSDKLRAEPINIEEMEKLGNQVEILYETKVEAINGESKLESVTLSKEYNGSKDLKVDGLFVEIGADPQVAVAESIGVELDENGYIRVNNLMETNISGAFAAGDTVNAFGAFKQTITAAATGAVAATSAYNYRRTKGNLCEVHWRVPSDVEGKPAES